VVSATGGKVIDCPAGVTAKLRKDEAGPYCALPPCVALIVHVPVDSRVAVEPATAQTDGVVDAKLTGKPDEAVALTLTVPADRLVDGIPAKLMV
jgi:hypothetical protein